MKHSSHWKGLAIALPLLLIAALPAGAFEIGARALYWVPALKADLRADKAGVVGTEMEAKDTLGLDNQASTPVEAFGGVGDHRITFSYTPMDYSGSRTLQRDVTFAGKTFATGTPVGTDLQLRMIDLAYQYTLLDLENLLAGCSLGVIGQLKLLDGEAKIAGGGQWASGDARLPVPMVGLSAHIGLLSDILEARAKLAGIAYSDHHLYEALADLSFTPLPFLDLHAGYKYIGIKIDQDDLFLDTHFTGPFLGLTVSF